MGKKTKKTTWRNLQIEDQQQQQQQPQQPCNSSITTISDSDESHITVNSFHNSASHYQRGRYQGSTTTGRWGGSVPPHHHQRYSSDERRPTKYNQLQQTWSIDYSRTSAKVAERSTSSGEGRYWATYRGSGKETGGGAQQGKITFNEDEYTRITTPRQDVLFKKGYLNRPRPSLTASSPASTTDGSGSMDLVTPESNSLLPTPDHVLLTPEGPFSYPTTGYIARDGLYFFNGFEPYPIVVYNAAPPQYCYSAAEFPLSSRSKRYSTDSMTESTSPHTEEYNGVDGDAALFLPPTSNTAAVQTSNSVTNVRRTEQSNANNQEPNEQNNGTNGATEQRKLKKKRRRKLSKPLVTTIGESTTTSVSASSCDDQQEMTTSSSDTEEIDNNTAAKHSVQKEKPEDSTSTCPNSPQSGSSSSSSITTHSSLSATEEQSSKASSQLKPDAKEFIPRYFAANTLEFVQQNQFHVIDQHGFIQPAAFMPMPILLSPVGPPHHFMLPPPAYNTLNHLPSAEIDEEHVQEEVQLTVDEVPNELHVEEAVQNSEIAMSEESKVSGLEDSVKVLVETPKLQPVSVQNNLSKRDICEIVSKLEEAAKEQENSGNMRNNKKCNKRFNINKRESTYGQKDMFKSVEGSPIRSSNSFKYNNNGLSKNFLPKSQQNLIGSPQHQRKQYSNMLKQPQVVQNHPAIKPAQKLKSPPIASMAPVKNILNTPNSCPVANKYVLSTAEYANQWINVSNRKKRRSNNVNNTLEDQQLEDVESDLARDKFTTESSDLKKELVVQEEVQLNINQMDDGFEKYDVDELVDVVIEVVKDMKIESEPEKITEPELEEVQIVVQEMKTVEVAPNVLKESISTEKDSKESKEIKEDVVNKNKNQNKKCNSKNSKPVKRVMVTDNIPPVIVKEIKEAPVKIIVEPVAKKIEENKEKAELAANKKDVQMSTESTPSKSSKKSNRKKSSSKVSNNNPATTNIELKADISKEDTASGSYNFLPTNSENKTNVEVSQELDILIQRGMYSSLEEKIRSFNITASNDGFFKTINYYGSGKLLNTENSFGNKDFNGILKDLKPAMNSKFEIGAPTDPSQILTKNSNNSYQDFLGLGPDLHEPDKRSPSDDDDDDDDEAAEDAEEQYPITRAVKEWMSKTREHTPDVELLKSPKTILKQFTSAELEDIEDDVTLWTLSNQDSIENDQDLLDCWETEESAVSCSDGTKNGGDNGGAFVDVVLKKDEANDGRVVSQGGNEKDGQNDVVLEDYDSKYGKNEDFLKIREEWEERSKTATVGTNSCSSRRKHRNVVLPPTASLPYRAICCAIM